MKAVKQQARNDRELTRWEAERARRPIAGYLAIMTIILGIVRMLDEFVTSAPTSVQSNIVQEFFVDGLGMTFETGLATLSLLTTALLLCSVVAVFFVALCDKLGRKKILLICTVGMTAGMLVCAVSTNIAVHLVGRAVITFFVATDVHQVFIMEIAPTEKRAFYTQITTVFGSVGVMLVGVVRMLYTSGGALDWRGVFTLPSLLGMAAVIGILIFARETDTFLDFRIAFLKKPVEQRLREAEEAKQAKRAQETVSGIGPAFRYVFSHRQTRALVFAALPISFATIAFASYYETIMSTAGMGVDAVNVTLVIYPAVQAGIALLAGWMTDRFGRKIAGATVSVTALVCFYFFITACRGGNPYLVGVLLGACVGAFWRYNEILTLTMRESVPTAIRTSSGSVIGLAGIVISLVSGVIFSLALAKHPVGLVCMALGGAALGISLVIYLAFVRETKGVVLDEIQ